MDNMNIKFDQNDEADNIIATVIKENKDIFSALWKDTSREQKTNLLFNIIDDPAIERIVLNFLDNSP